MSHVHDGPLATYNSLLDPHLAGYFSNTGIRRHLRKAKLVTRKGAVVTESQYRLQNARAEHRKQVREMLAQAIVHKTLDMERQRQAKVKNKLEEIGKIELVKRVKAERKFGYEDTIMDLLRPPSEVRRRRLTASGKQRSRRGSSESLPYLSSRTGKNGRRSVQSARSNKDRKDYSGRQSRAHMSRGSRSSLSSYYSSRPSSRDDSGKPSSEYRKERHESTASSTSFSSAMTSESEREGHVNHPRGGRFSEPIDDRNLSALDDRSLGQYDKATGGEKTGKNISPYTDGESASGPMWKPHPPPKKPGPNTPRDEHGRPIKSAKHPHGRQILHRQEPAFKHEKEVQTFCEVTLKYLGGSYSKELQQELMVHQQHCGGNTLTVFKEFVKPKSNFTFTSKRHRGYPFGLTLFIDGTQDTTVSTCCEYKHKTGCKLGSKTSHFVFVKVSGAEPCYKCKVEAEMAKKDGKTKQKNTKNKKERANESDKENQASTATKNDANDDEYGTDFDDEIEMDEYCSDFERTKSPAPSSESDDEDKTAREVKSFEDELEVKSSPPRTSHSSTSSRSSSSKSDAGNEPVQVAVGDSDEEMNSKQLVEHYLETIARASSDNDEPNTTTDKKHHRPKDEVDTQVERSHSAHSDKSSIKSVKSEKSDGSHRPASRVGIEKPKNSDTESIKSSSSRSFEKPRQKSPTRTGYEEREHSDVESEKSTSRHSEKSDNSTASRKSTRSNKSASSDKSAASKSSTASKKSSFSSSLASSVKSAQSEDSSASTVKEDKIDESLPKIISLSDLSKQKVVDTCEQLSVNAKLEVLEITKSEIGNDGATLLVDSLEKSGCKLLEITLNECNIGHLGATKIKRLIKSPLKKLSLSGNPMTDSGVAKVVNEIRITSEIERLDELNLDRCFLTSESMESLAKLISEGKVTRLSLNDNRVIPTTAWQVLLTSVASEGSRLTHLDISKNLLGKKPMVERICNSMASLESLSVLDLSDNQLTDIMVQQLLERKAKFNKLILEPGNELSKKRIEALQSGEEEVSSDDSSSSDESASPAPSADSQGKKLTGFGTYEPFTSESSESSRQPSIASRTQSPDPNKLEVRAATPITEESERTDSEYKTSSISSTVESDSETEEETTPRAKNLSSTSAKVTAKDDNFEDDITTSITPDESVKSYVKGQTHINLSGLSNQQMEKLIKLLSKQQNIVSLKVANCKLADREVSSLLLSVLKSATTLQVLHLTNVGITPADCSNLVESLPKLENLIDLSLERNNLGDYGAANIIKVFADEAKAARNKLIDLRARKVTKESMQAAIKSPSLASIVSNPDSEHSSSAESKPSKFPEIKKLNLSNCGVANATLEQIKPLLIANCLKELHLAGNRHVTQYGWSDLLQTISKSNSNLDKLDLSNNNLRKLALAALAGSKISEVNLADNSLTDETVREVIPYLQNKPTRIEKWILEPGNNITPDTQDQLRNISVGV